MESTSLDSIKEQLQQQRSEIEAKAETLRSELGFLDDDLSRINAAIAVLDGAALSPATGKVVKPKERKKMQTPSAGKADVIKCLRSVLAERGTVEAKALKTIVEEQIAKAGFTRMGLSLRFKEALADSQFVETPAGVRIKEEKRTAAKA